MKAHRPISDTIGARGSKSGSGGGGTAKKLKTITPEVRRRLERRVEKATDDAGLSKVVRDAAKYGVDWSYLLP